MYENIILKADVATVIHKLRFVNVSWGIVHLLPAIMTVQLNFPNSISITLLQNDP